ncbi:hypothetical protein [Bradyrhizobium sp.]|uniref:hypothetical protein n=1 Tax=Bradyrhizobium sp. TaxID=376 RepID=UPI0025C4A068|nr:hypothetical protein [Bradyrhizobium sp.]
MPSKQLAGLIGPTLVALGATEALNIHIFENQIAAVIYLNGTILFVVGLALVRAHNRWSWRWPTLITVTGWVLLAGGLYRMIAPEAPQAPANAGSYVALLAIVAIGVFLSFKGYGPEAAQAGE